MKAKYVLITLLTVTFFGCDDNTAGLGLGVFPGSDQNINGHLSTFDVITESVPAGDIYAKTNIGYVGKFTDATFGTYKAGFMAELNCPQGLTFPAVYTVTETETSGAPKKAKGTMVADDNEDNKDVIFIKDDEGKIIGNIHTIELSLWYNKYFGDSLTACRLSVYELNKDLNEKEAYYTNIKPESYCDKATGLLGTKAYTAVDLSVKDSTRNLSSYVPGVHLRLKDQIAKNLGERIFQSSRKHGSNFYKYFNDIFKGIYVESDYGDGTVLYIEKVQMNVVYKCYMTDSISGLKIKKKVKENGDLQYKDSTNYIYTTFVSTREVVQANQLTNQKDVIDNIIKQDDNTYLKTPAGIFTQAVLPINEIENKLQGDTLNAVKIIFTNYNQESDKKFGMSIPASVMLIRKKNKDTFFEKNQIADDITSYSTNHRLPYDNQYVFSNITRMINSCIEDRQNAIESLKKGPIEIDTWDNEGYKKKMTVSTIEEWEKNSGWDQALLIPVLITLDSSSSSSNYGYGSQNPKIIGIQHDLKPGYVRLKGGSKGFENPAYRLKMEVISTSFNSK